MDRHWRALLAGTCLLLLVLACHARVQPITRVPFESLRCPSSGMTCDYIVDGGVGCCARGADGSAATWVCPTGLGGRAVSRPRPVAGLIGAVHVEVSGYGLCARLSDGTVRCYGSNDREALGLGSGAPQCEHLEPWSVERAECERLEPRTQCRGTAVALPVEGIDAATALFGRCALQRGELLCWGDNSHGELLGTSGPASSVAVPLADFGAEVAAVDGLCAVLEDDGRVACWGEASRSPANGLVGVEQLAMNSPYGGAGCALIHGRVYCWGRTSPNQATRVAGLGRALQVGSAGGFACALLEDETVSCWGSNEHGQLGDGTTEDRDQPLRVPELDNVKQIQVGLFRACARLGDGGVSCWGSLPTDDGNADHLTPTRIDGLPPVVRVTLGGSNTLCAITESTQVYCWGNIFAPEDPIIREPAAVPTTPRQPPPERIAEDAIRRPQPRPPVRCTLESIYCSDESCYSSEDECLDARALSKPLDPGCERFETTYIDQRYGRVGPLCACRDGQCRRCSSWKWFEQCHALPEGAWCGSPDWDTGELVPDTELAARCTHHTTVDHPSAARSRYCVNGAISMPRSCPPPPPGAGNDYCPPEWVEQERCFRTAEECDAFRAVSAEHAPDTTEPRCRLIWP